ncbi:type VII secretion system-associated protein (plasmid) [Streptomyces sp. NBC_01717]|uniref:type VII secretion system-associated protein n=1 Tax=Streptomyces sp. NBC_01717 TaxID=2975918 RepID=UPI002E32E46E|nr:type VII secretion system-associated protein [Streptomyces sp. NBC_01717]
MAPTTTVLDSDWLKEFIKEHVVEFRAALENLLKDDPSGLSMETISLGDISSKTIMSKRPLILGPMAGDGDLVGGSALNEKVKKTATDINKIFTDHKVLFADLEDALWETIKELTENQKKSLDEISADEFLDIFDDVDSDISSTGQDQTQN